MLQPAQLQLFILSSLALLVVPGPAVLYIVARSVSQGRLAGLASAAGVQVGAMLHILAAALGLSALLLSSSLAFSIVKYLGAAYLIYLGIRRWLSREGAADVATVRPESLRRIFAQGVIVNALNPKTALFFFAFLPQFVDPGRGDVAAQMLLLGLVFITLAVINDGIYALLAGSLGERLRDNRRLQNGGRLFAGLAYIGLGVTAALSGSTNP
ncbi:MAG: LysE family translocator [Thermoflexales bacterium]|nr:LysE family translocator [Thermoflexales bacterium]MDW8351701.1 LysE family translocator [Anaerolineae bacterium]